MIEMKNTVELPEEKRKENQNCVSEGSVFCSEIEDKVYRQKQIEKKQVCKYHNFVFRPYNVLFI